jgi:hypothetical protein
MPIMPAELERFPPKWPPVGRRKRDHVNTRFPLKWMPVGAATTSRVR